MGKYIVKRLLLAFLTTFIILSLTFILMKLLPFSMPLGTKQVQYSYFMKMVQEGLCVKSYVPLKGYGDVLFTYNGSGKLVEYFYETPIFTQYFSWLRNIVTKWNWGTSTYLAPNGSAFALILKRLPASMYVNILSTIFSVPLGIVLGIWAALKKNKPTDNIISTAVMVFISVPSFVLITISMAIFCYKFHWLPTQWPGSSALLKTKILGYILPVFVLSFGSICGYCRFTRAELCEVMESDYLLLARTKGLTKQQAIIRHALKNAMVPIIPSILAEVIGILGGSMILESLYGIPGIGSLFVEALNSQDYNVLFVDMALFTTISLVAGVFLDLSYGLIDPRIRMGAKNNG